MLQGILLDFWQRPIPMDGGKFFGDVGLFGPDAGEGGKFLLLPPGYTGKVPEGCFVYRSGTFNARPGVLRHSQALWTHRGSDRQELETWRHPEAIATETCRTANRGESMPEENRAKRHLLNSRAGVFGALSVALLVAASMPANAQYLGLNLRGDTGLKSGSQAGPGYYFVLPLYSVLPVRSPKLEIAQRQYGARRQQRWSWAPCSGGSGHYQVEDPRSELRIPSGCSVYGQPAKPRGRSRREESRLWLRDTYIQAHQSGRAREARGFPGSVWVLRTDRPTTLDMWAHEIVLGTTVYLDDAKNRHVAGTMFYHGRLGSSCTFSRPFGPWPFYLAPAAVAALALFWLLWLPARRRSRPTSAFST